MNATAMTSPIPPAAAARCREVVRLLEARAFSAQGIERVKASDYAEPQRSRLLRTYEGALSEIDTELSKLHRPAVSVERLRAALAAPHGHEGQMLVDNIEALIAEAAQ